MAQIQNNTIIAKFKHSYQYIATAMNFVRVQVPNGPQNFVIINIDKI